MQQGTLSNSGVATAHYALLTGLQGETHWVLVDAGGAIQLASRPYYNADEALGGVELARRAAAGAGEFERWETPAGYGFTLHSREWELALSAPYADAARREAAIRRVQADARTLAVLDLRHRGGPA